jgi:hypothetical protein
MMIMKLEPMNPATFQKLLAFVYSEENVLRIGEIPGCFKPTGYYLKRQPGANGGNPKQLAGIVQIKSVKIEHLGENPVEDDQISVDLEIAEVVYVNDLKDSRPVKPPSRFIERVLQII